MKDNELRVQEKKFMWPVKMQVYSGLFMLTESRLHDLRLYDQRRARWSHWHGRLSSQSSLRQTENVRPGLGRDIDGDENGTRCGPPGRFLEQNLAKVDLHEE